MRETITEPHVENDDTCRGCVLGNSARKLFLLGSDNWPKGILDLKYKEEVFNRFQKFKTERETSRFKIDTMISASWKIMCGDCYEI